MIDPFNAHSVVYNPSNSLLWNPLGTDSPKNIQNGLEALRQMFQLTAVKETAYTANHNEIVHADPDSIGAFTITLPAIISGVYTFVGIKRWSTASNTLTIDTTGLDKIDLSSSSITYDVLNGGLILVSNGIANWYQWLRF